MGKCKQSGCSIVGKPLYYHASDPGLIPRGPYTTGSYQGACRGFLVLESRCPGFLVLESRCRGFLVLESRCRVFLVLESRCRGFGAITLSYPPLLLLMTLMKKRGWKLYRSPNPRGVRKCNSAVVFWSWNLDVVAFWSCNLDVVVYVPPRPRFRYHRENKNHA